MPKPRESLRFAFPAVATVLARWLPKRTLRLDDDPNRPADGFVLGPRPLYCLKGQGGPDGEGRVHAKREAAATIVLVVEEYLRFGQEPPEELLAFAALCWLEGLVTEAEGYSLRQCRREA